MIALELPQQLQLLYSLDMATASSWTTVRVDFTTGTALEPEQISEAVLARLQAYSDPLYIRLYGNQNRTLWALEAGVVLKPGVVTAQFWQWILGGFLAYEGITGIINAITGHSGGSSVDQLLGSVTQLLPLMVMMMVMNMMGGMMPSFGKK
jgi:hypothetical protein